ncbi:transmembrane protein KIAA1109 isoform X3 [Harmonia axyridis]|uniref:transmembrane protein KIAA1109 isoform X3 n=1 Tax=Harmonia axyridis TaxID=115357 RepID=UPI001E2783A0|nr:transmembrane protein KIAA1109 isoform X3 [Harmonia axyridis]
MDKTMLFTTEGPEAMSWGLNSTNHGTFKEIKMDSNFLMLLASLVFAVSWVVYIAYYNSRVFGYIITKIVNRLFISEGYFKIGSFSFNALSGKIMFRDVVYISYDYTARVQDGYLIFRWWRSYIPKDVSEDLSHSDTRLSIMLIGFELHVYNRCDVYSKLEEIFGLKEVFAEHKISEHLNVSESLGENSSVRKQRPEAAMARTWRDLIPVIKCDISSSRLVFGNRLIPTTLSISFEESHFVYSTKPAVCTLDKFMHFVKCKGENVKVMLAPSLKYTGLTDQPPRYMGEGFVLLQSNNMELYFYMDEPGLVPEEPVLVTLPNGDIVASSAPKWGIDIKCGKSTNFSYGPWADRQREHLFKFFYPQDYLPMEVTKTPKPGDKRQMESFEVRMLVQNDATIDVLFTKDKETNAVHINIGAGSYLEVTIPWVTKPNGFTNKINGQLLHVEATTSLQFRDFIKSETLEFGLECHYPLVWNEHQLWKINLTACKATIHVIFSHKWFFQDMINDWASKQRPDLIHFVPYTWQIALNLKHCELLTLVNQYNWIDCSSVGQRSRLENTMLGCCAHFIHLSFDLPFDEYLPETIPLNFGIQGESIDLSLFIPEFHSTRNTVTALHKHSKLLSKDGTTTKKTELIPKWRNVCKESDGWVDFWWVPIGAINIMYTFHPQPPLGPQPQADISTPVKEEILLSPMRFPHNRKNRKRPPEGFQKFDPTTLKADTVNVELEIGPSVLRLYGTALKNFMNFKENIFGEDQSFTDMQQANNQDQGGELKTDDSNYNIPLELREDFDKREYRPLEVDVSIVIHDIQAHLLKHCTEKDPPCPVILVERFGFEMKKRYEQTELQLLLSPAVLLVSDNMNRGPKHKHLNQGKITLSSIQVRGHAMFSDVDRSLDQDTLEYAWLVEVHLGKLTGKLTTPQLCTLSASIETLVVLILDDENELIHPSEDDFTAVPEQRKKSVISTQPLQQAFQQFYTNVMVKNQHNSNSVGVQGMKFGSTDRSSKNNLKSAAEKKKGEDLEKKGSLTKKEVGDAVNQDCHKLKYKFTRVAVDALDIWLVESGTALQLWVSPLRLSTCNLHGKQVNSGLSCIAFSLSLRQLIWQQQKYNHKSSTDDLWLEVGAVNFGPIIVESAISSADAKDQNAYEMQQKFLRMHDERQKKLWFLWPELNKVQGRCGCTGGCCFFGENKNGPRFFRPSKTDLEDGINVSAFRINEPGMYPGFGQSILHERMLIFRTTPYIYNEIYLQDVVKQNTKVDNTGSLKKSFDSPRMPRLEREKSVDTEKVDSPITSLERKTNRRFSSSSVRSAIIKEVPYARLVETCPPLLTTAKLDSDSKLHMEKGKLSVTSGDVDFPPKNSVSDSKLAVDYFNSPKPDNFEVQLNSGPGSDVSASSPGANISLNESESQHSIGTRHSSEERLQKEVQRTTSMSSENHSEAFFSADEDLHLNSRSSSLRNSILSTGGILMRQERQPILASSQGPRKKFSSELSIVTDRSAMQRNGVVLQAPGSAPETTRTRLSSHRSDHEIHTPEHRSFTLNRQNESIHRSSAVQGLATPNRNPSNRSVSPRLWPQTSTISQPDSDINHPELDARSSSSGTRSSDNLSNNSFLSAQGSQEDFTLIDLHRQVNRPIVDSSMLMSSYVTHLSQLRCTNWNDSAHEGPIDQFSLSLFERIDNKLVYSGGRFVPQMETVMDGMTSMKMVTRCDSSAGNKTPTSPFVYSWEQEELDKELQEVQEEEILGFQTQGGCRTTIIVKIKGDLDVMVSPLLLESFQRFVDSLTSTVSGLHPLTVINHLHTSCIGQVAAANVLQTTENVRKICQSANGLNDNSDSTNLGSYEECIKTQLQAAIFLPKVNVTFLQVSIVEEIISFSALDNVKDFTCVSLLSVCFDNIVMKFHCDKQAKEILQKFHRPAVVQTGSKKGANRARILLGLQTYTNADIIKGEPVFIESCKKLQKQLVFCLNIGKVHGQLRRLKNESSILDDAVITAIPSYKSKVLFTPAKMRPLYRGIEYYLQPSYCESISAQQEENNTEDKLGFIMFECGLEGINLKIVKKSEFEEECEDDKKEKKTETSGTSGDPDKGNEDCDPLVEDRGTTSRPCSATPKNGDRLSSLQRPTTPKVSNDKGDKKCKDKEKNAGTSQPGTSQPTENCKDNAEKDMGNVSSCVIELKVVWFNFAAPPRAPITRKIDYTRLDWNLLSTASPAINAWMNPSNRLAIRVVHLVRTMYRRSTATVACIMAEALDIQRVHTLPKSRYGKLTPLSQTLQNDPNLQLCSILERYYLEIGASVIESHLKENEMPQLFTLRQGIVVLSRQWKNILYTPLLGQHTMKSRVKPLSTTIAIPEVTEEVTLTDGETSANEEHDISDENARLLHNFKTGTDISTQKDHTEQTTSPRSSGYLDGTGPNPQIAVVPRGVESMLTSPSPPVPNRKRKKSLPHVPPPNSSRASVILPLLNNGYPFVQKRSQPDDSIGYGALREDRTIINMGSDPSEVNSGSSPELPSSPLHRTLGNTNFSEDMYSWMAKQDTTTNTGKAPLEGCLESKINTLQTESSGEPDTLPRENLAAPEVSLAPIQDSGRLLDANQIFQPVLSVLGVIPQQLRFTTVSESSAGNEVTTLDALGSNFCLVGSMDTMRIDIVVSEADYGKHEKKKGRNKNKQKLFIDIPVDESPSFVCEKISVEIEIERIADMNVNEMMKSENIFYISRSQLKNHTSTVINFTIGVHYISQRVNMPLLRLLHQISNMYQNVKDARNEMHEQQPTEIRRPKTSASDHLDMKLHSSNSALHDHHVDLSKQLSIKVSDAGSYTSSQMHKAAISPSPSLRSRPQSFAQKLISTSKSVKGYINLNEGIGTPITMSSPSGSALDRATVSSDKSMTNAGRCWKTIYHLIDLYSNMPETKTINHRFSMGNCGDISEHYKGNRKYDLLTEMKSSEEIDKEMTPPLNINKDSKRVHFKHVEVKDKGYIRMSTTQELSKLVVFGVARIHRTKLLATLSGLKLEAEITSLHSSLTCRNKSTPNILEYSITGQVGKTMIVLLEGTAPNLQTVVRVTIGKSQTLYSSVSKRSKDKNAGLLTIGAVNIDIPQHPVALHGMVTRGSKQLSSTIQELRVTRTASRMSRGQQADEEGPNSPNHPLHMPHIFSSSYMKSNVSEKSLLQPLVMQFSVILQSLSITAALLPSLQAQYKMDQVNSTGFTGSKAKFTIDLPHHSLSFNTKLQGDKAEANLPSEASISLPAIHVSAEYIPENAVLGPRNDQREHEGAVFKPGGYLNAKADIGIFKHSLTTDLLNHLVFVQKVFMKEINEVIQKVYGGERPVPLWLEESEEPSSLTRILFSLIIRIQGIEITATTAGSSAVRLETGEVVFELSNRIQNISRASKNSTAAKLFGKAQVDLKLSLGQLIRNALFEEAEIEFQPVAFFNTRIGLRNAFQDEIVEGEDKEVVLLTLKRPLVYIQPAAIDKAILVWLNYKNAYDYWNEKRANLNKEMLFATNQVPEKFQLGQLTSQLSTQHLGTLFMQLTVEDMGICLPLNPLPLNWNQRNFHEDIRGAVVVTLENTSISACSSGCLVSKGKFSNLCLRFADDFENSFDDWKPDMNDSSIMNLCVVSDGTYDFCSRTIAAKQPNENAKWFLSVQWQMEGVDIHLDTNIGKQLSALGHTLTMLTGAEDPPLHMDYDSDDNDTPDGLKASQESILKTIGATTDHRARSKAIEKAMNEQAKIINDLRSLGASHGTIEDEMKKLHELEELVYKDFRRDMIQKLRRQSVRASSIKRKFGLGDRQGDTAFRSKSFVMSHPMPERDYSPDNGQGMSGSYESSPTSGPSRSSSLRVKNIDNGLRVHFNEQPPTRKSSLPSACSDLSIAGSQIDWVDQLDIDGEKVQLRKKMPNENNPFDTTHPYSSSNFSSNSGVSQKPQEPNVDLELDVKVFINSGKCVLHTKDIQTVQEDAKLTKMKKDRSCSAGLLEFPPNSSSPDPLRRNKDKNMGQFGTSRLRMNPHASLVDLTIFHIPGMDVKLHYVSKVVPEAEGQPDLQAQNSDFEKAFNNTRSFSATFSSDETEEMRIDKAFKRQDSQPFSFPPQQRVTTPPELRTSTSLHGITNPNYGSSPTCSSSGSSEDLRCGATPPISPVNGARANVNLGAGNQIPTKKMGVKKAQLFAWMTLQSVPEETIISPHILEFLEQTLEPIPAKSTFRNGDTSLMSSDQDNTNYGNYVYASFPVDVIVYFHMQPSTFRFSCLPVSRVECLLKLPSLDIVFSSKRAEDELLQSEFGDGLPNSVSTAVGGLSVTACLSDFSVYIFHPYGGKKTTLKESHWSPLSDSERKDSLSINVEFVKIHLSRSRMLNFQQQDMSFKGKSSGDQGQSRAVIRFSTITDIGSASFKYDMRRLTEILAFPKAWYRRSIVRRMFLGDLSMSATHTDDGESSSYNSSPGAYRTHENRGSKSTDKSPLLANRERLRLGKLKEFGIGLSSDSNQENNSPSEHKNMTSWETLVLFAVNFKKLNVHMNMGNVMGNVSWLTKEFRSDGRLGIGSTGHKNLYIALGLGGSGLDAKGGIVGGNIEIANIDTFIHIREEPDVEPDHTVGVKLHALELRLDYMASSVLMFRVSDLKVNLRDEWKLNRAASKDSFIPTRRPAMIFMHGDLGWDQLQMMISKNTTTDLLKMFNKLEEFFSQQFNSSKRAFSGYSSSSRHSKNNSQKAKDQTNQQNPAYQIEANHHRHWQRVLATIAGLQLNTMPSPLPQYGTVLGGTMELHGNNISLACFHGVNFKSKSWALFSLKEPCITFNTEAQEIPSSSKNPPAQDVHIVQTLTCSLGLSTYKTDLSMATVCKVSRTVMFPPQFKTWQEWFHYTFASSQIDEVDRFPSLERERSETTNSFERSRGNQQKLPDPNLNREVIFAVPSLQLHLKTEHLQTSSIPETSDENKPSVECSFITEFEDHIFVTVDAEAFFFLHDVITSYIREKEKVDPKQKDPQVGSTDPNRKGSIDSNIFSTDWRDFTCKTWHLEPTVRLLSVAGKYIEPYGVDYILQKLGFSHARVTIPKWMQRGFMDPLDATLAVLTLKMIQVVRGEGNKNEKEKAMETKKLEFK